MASQYGSQKQGGLISQPLQRLLDIGNHRLAVVAMVGLYLFLCYFVFVDVIGSDLNLVRSGFEYHPPVDGSILLACFAAFMPLLWLRMRCEQLSDVLILQVYFFVFVPSCIYLTMAAPGSIVRQFTVLVMLMAGQMLLEMRRYVPVLGFLRFPMSAPRVEWLIFGLGLVAAIYLALFGELTLERLSLENVYDRRAEIIEYGGRTLPLYVANWASSAIAPLAIYLGVVRRNILLGLLGLVLAIESFTATSFRSQLFLPIFAAAVGLVARWLGPNRIGFLMAAVALAMTILPLAMDFLTGSVGFYSWLIHFRFIGNNGFLTAQYLDFFEFARKGLYQDSFGRFLFDPVYNMPIAELLGSSFSMEGNHANGNFWADGYGNAGFAGIIFASLSLVALCAIVDSVVDSAFRSAAVVSVVVIGFGVGNTAVHSVLTSNGGILVLLLLLIFPPAQSAQPKYSAS